MEPKMNQKAESKKTENQLNKSVMAAAMVTAFVTTFMSSALNLSIPALESYFHVSAATVSWVVSTYTMAVAAMSLPFGKLADAAGMKKVFLTGIAGFGILSLVSPFSANIGFLLACRTLQGACGAMMFATNNSILIKAHPREMQGRVLGLSVAATYAGLTLGPALGGVLNRTLGWKAIFILSAGTAAVAYFVSTKGVPADEKTVKEIKTGKIDKAGALLYVTAVVTSLYGLTDFTVSVRARFILAAGVILIAGFFHRETKAENPLMKVSMFTTSRTFTFSNLAALLNYGATFAITYEVSIYLQMVKGFSSIYGSHHKFYGAMDFFYMSAYYGGFTPGLQNAYVGATWKPAKALSLDLAYHFLATAAKLRNAEQPLGHEVEFSASYDLGHGMSLSTGYSFMRGTETMVVLKRTSDKRELHWCWLMFRATPKFLQSKR